MIISPPMMIFSAMPPYADSAAIFDGMMMTPLMVLFYSDAAFLFSPSFFASACYRYDEPLRWPLISPAMHFLRHFAYAIDADTAD
jgi:hypothetical protein